MLNLYEHNGLIFWEQSEIKLRRWLEEYFSEGILLSLQQQNASFHMVQVEAPLLTPRKFVNKNYTEDDIYIMDKIDNSCENYIQTNLVLRPETTMGSYEYAKHILSGHHSPKFKPPVIIFQHGKSFRKEQDQPTKFMRLKEFYQLEFQIIFGQTTMNDYSVKLYDDVQLLFNKLLGDCYIEISDRLPDYSEETKDIVFCNPHVNPNILEKMELCSMSKRKDLEGYKVIEIAIGTDRVIYNYNLKITDE